MRIIGGKDYYDSAAAYGIDPTIVFVRSFPRTFQVEQFAVKPVKTSWHCVRKIGDRSSRILFNDWTFTAGRDQFIVDFFTIVFAGERYGGASVTSLRNSKDVKFFYSMAGLTNHLKEHGYEITSGRWNSSAKGIRRHFEEEVSQDERVWLIENRVSIAIHLQESKTWEVDSSNLRLYDFAKIMPPVEAHQTLSQWVGGTLPRAGNPTVEIVDDTIKAQKHGFDDWSFRKKSAAEPEPCRALPPIEEVDFEFSDVTGKWWAEKDGEKLTGFYDSFDAAKEDYVTRARQSRSP